MANPNDTLEPKEAVTLRYSFEITFSVSNEDDKTDILNGFAAVIESNHGYLEAICS